MLIEKTRTILGVLAVGLLVACTTPQPEPEPPPGPNPVPGALAVTVANLPPGLPAAIRVTGPGGYSQDITQSQTLSGLAPGEYTLDGNGVLAFLRHPDQLAKLRADPKLIAAAVEEVLRYDPPISITGRVASRDMELGGEAIEARDALISYLRAANRDPAVYDDPERFDIARKHVPHMAFGGGAHICIGAPLARMEGQVALWKLFERFPNLKLAEQEFTYRALPGFRGLEQRVVEP